MSDQVNSLVEYATNFFTENVAMVMAATHDAEDNHIRFTVNEDNSRVVPLVNATNYEQVVPNEQNSTYNTPLDEYRTDDPPRAYDLPREMDLFHASRRRWDLPNRPLQDPYLSGEGRWTPDALGWGRLGHHRNDGPAIVANVIVDWNGVRDFNQYYEIPMTVRSLRRRVAPAPQSN